MCEGLHPPIPDQWLAGPPERGKDAAHNNPGGSMPVLCFYWNEADPDEDGHEPVATLGADLSPYLEAGVHHCRSGEERGHRSEALQYRPRVMLG